jgi:hypothetical protein
MWIASLDGLHKLPDYPSRSSFHCTKQRCVLIRPVDGLLGLLLEEQVVVD